MVLTAGSRWRRGPIRRTRPSGDGRRSCRGVRSAGDRDPSDRQLAGRAGTVEIVDDPENLKGRLYEKRRQTSVRRQMNWSLVGKCDEIELLRAPRAENPGPPCGRRTGSPRGVAAAPLRRSSRRSASTPPAAGPEWRIESARRLRGAGSPGPARWTSGTGTTWKRFGGWAIASLLPRGSALMPPRSAE